MTLHTHPSLKVLAPNIRDTLNSLNYSGETFENIINSKEEADKNIKTPIKSGQALQSFFVFRSDSKEVTDPACVFNGASGSQGSNQRVRYETSEIEL